MPLRIASEIANERHEICCDARARLKKIPRDTPNYCDAHRRYLISLDAYDVIVDECRRLFAIERGWIISDRYFSLRQLQKASNCRMPWEGCNEHLHPAIDHAEYYRLPERYARPAAILSHSYASDGTIQTFASANGLVAEVLDCLSWYYPGNTRAVVFTREM